MDGEHQAHHAEITRGLKREFEVQWDETLSIIGDGSAPPPGWHPPGAPGVNTTTVIVTHLCGAHTFWVGELVGERPSGRDRPAEFASEVTEKATRASLVSLVGATREEINRTLDLVTDCELPLPARTGVAPGTSTPGASAAPGRSAGPTPSSHPLIKEGRPVTRLFCLLHALTHHAHHNGQLRLLARLWREMEGGRS